MTEEPPPAWAGRRLEIALACVALAGSLAPGMAGSVSAAAAEFTPASCVLGAPVAARPSAQLGTPGSVAFAPVARRLESTGTQAGSSAQSGATAPAAPVPLDVAEPAQTGSLSPALPPDVAEPAQTGRLSSSAPPGPFTRYRGILGLFVLTGIAWALSSNRRLVQWRVVLWGLGLQIAFALLILRTPLGTAVFSTANDLILAVVGFTEEGARFLFGNLVRNEVPVGLLEPSGGEFAAEGRRVARTGAFVAFNVLPTIIFFASLMTVLYHLGVMQRVVGGIAWVMRRTMKTSGAETLTVAGNIFIGQTEAPLLVKPFVERMTRSELMAIMTGGFATVAGGVMAAYAGILSGFFPDIAGHLMAASVMSAPAAMLVAKLMLPEEERPDTAGGLSRSAGGAVERPDVNVIEAAARGAGEGLHLALNVGAMLMAFLAMIALLNAVLGWTGGLVGLDGLSLESVLGAALAPIAWVMGVPWQEAPAVGALMGLKTVATEFVAYMGLADDMARDSLSPRSAVIAAYAISGFANFSSIAIQIGGIGGIAPSRRKDLARLGLRAMVGGSLAAFMTAAIAGALV